MAIEDKIKEIQGKSERVRMMYIVAFVAIIMTFVVALWIFSIRVDVQAIVGDMSNASVLPDNGGHMQEIRDAINSSGDAIDNALDKVEEVGEINSDQENSAQGVGESDDYNVSEDKVKE